MLGLMSGTSLDGLDLALCRFEHGAGALVFEIEKAQTVAYAHDWKMLLSEAPGKSAAEYFSLHARYGKYIADQVNTFLKGIKVKPQAIASHGHTVFHRPQLGFSTQLGCGATIAAHTGLTTVCDFRSLDVALGGQGAPLVPLGDKLLFGDYAACLNIGGIANVSFDDARGQRVAYDICEANLLLNHLAAKAGKPYDDSGHLARSGSVHQPLLLALNRLDFYTLAGAKSLGREWFEKEVLPLMEHLNMPINDLLATATEHVATIIASALNEKAKGRVLVTGGGALNTFLMDRIRFKTEAELVVPDMLWVNFKEALVFAFLGHLRLNGDINTLSAVTGARADSIGGAVYKMS